MIVIVANRTDPTARACASRWATEDVGILTPKDLSTAGWRQPSGSFNENTAVIEGKLIPHRQITGVLTLLPCVTEGELVDIAPPDRAYVAAEMTAFLLYWLSSLKCPVLNRPTPMCLSGPYWRREAWVSAAVQAGIPVQTFRRSAAWGSGAEEEMLQPSTVVTVSGKSVVGDVDPKLHLQARRLAGIAGVQLLAVHFSSPEPDARFLTASSFASLADDSVAEAVLDYLRPAASV